MSDFSNYDPRVVQIFQKYDINHNKVLERTELCKSLTEIVQVLDPNMDKLGVESVVDEAIKRFDLNHNGMLEIDEFNLLIRFLVDEKGLEL